MSAWTTSASCPATTASRRMRRRRSSNSSSGSGGGGTNSKSGSKPASSASIGRARDGVRIFTASILDGRLRVSVRQGGFRYDERDGASVRRAMSSPTSVTAIRSPDMAATRTSRPSSISANIRKRKDRRARIGEKQRHRHVVERLNEDEKGTGQDSRSDERQRHPPQCRAPVRAERRRSLLERGVDALRDDGGSTIHQRTEYDDMPRNRQPERRADADEACDDESRKTVDQGSAGRGERSGAARQSRRCAAKACVTPIAAGTANRREPRTARPAIFSELNAAMCSVAERTGSSSASYQRREKPCGGNFSVCPAVKDVASATPIGATR